MLTAGGEGAADSLRERSSGKQVSVRLRLQLGVVGKAGVPPEGVVGVGVQETRRPPHCLDTHTQEASALPSARTADYIRSGSCSGPGSLSTK